MRKESKNDVVVITGASAGVGRATAKKFAKHGCSIGLIARGIEGLEGAKRDVEKLGGKALILQADVANADKIENAASRIEEEFGPIDIWINNTMTTVFSSFKDIKADEFKRVTEVTYLGFVYGTMAALKRMRERNKGVIVQVGSALAYRGIPLQSAYCGAKHAIEGFTESLRSELIHDKVNVHITMVQMPALNTPQFNWCKTNFDKKPQPVPPIYQPEIAADAVYYAAYHRRREMYVGFRNTVIIWGNKFFPGFGDKYLAKNGYESQMLNEKVNINRPSNLWEPVDVHKDFGAHGDFDKRAVKESWHLKINKHKEVFIPAVTVAVVLIVIAMIMII
jgi:short-subunit dehydrogenase